LHRSLPIIVPCPLNTPLREAMTWAMRMQTLYCDTLPHIFDKYNLIRLFCNAQSHLYEQSCCVAQFIHLD